MVALATAHPAKFPDAVKAAAGHRSRAAGAPRRHHGQARAVRDTRQRRAGGRRLHRGRTAAPSRKRSEAHDRPPVAPSVRPDGRHPRDGPPGERRARRLGRRRLALGARARARPVASPRAHGLQGHAHALGHRHRRGDRGGRRRGQRRHQRRDDLLLRPRAQGRRAARRRYSFRHPAGTRSSTRTNSSASSTSSCRRSARRSIRPTTASTTCSPRPPTPTSRSAAPSSARRRPCRRSARRCCATISTATIAARRWCIAAAGAVDHDAIVALAGERFGGLGEPTRPDACGRRATSGGERARGARPHGNADHARLRGPSLHLARLLHRADACRRSSAAACRRGCSRKCARSAASAIRSTPSTGASPTPACSASTPRPDRSDVAELMPVVARRTGARRPRHQRDRARPRPGAAPRRAADDAGEPGGARRPARPPDAPLRPVIPVEELVARIDAITVDDVAQTRRGRSSPAARRRLPRSARSTG